jgi:hypothetical protein
MSAETCARAETQPKGKKTALLTSRPHGYSIS